MAVLGGGTAEIGNGAGVGTRVGVGVGVRVGVGVGVGTRAGAGTEAEAEAKGGKGFALSTDVAIGAEASGGGSTCNGAAAELSPALLLFGPSLESSISAARAFRLPRAARKLCTKDLRGTFWA